MTSMTLPPVTPSDPLDRAALAAIAPDLPQQWTAPEVPLGGVRPRPARRRFGIALLRGTGKRVAP